MSQSAKQEQPAQSAQTLTVFEGFTGLQTQPSRYGLGDKECLIMDGFFPAGKDLARVIYDNGPDQNISVVQIAYFDFANIGATPYAIIFLIDGGVFALNTNTLVSNPIGTVGALPSPASGHIAISQWGSQYVLIVVDNQPNGYFIWDGTTFYSAGMAIPGFDGPGPILSSSLASGGSGYAVNDTGTVAVATNDSTYIVTTVNAATHGTGYAANDTGVITTGDGNATYIINTVDGFGGVTGMHITSGGSNYLTANNVATATGGAQPGAGTGLTLNISVSSPPGPITGFTLSGIGVVTGYTLTSPGTGYSSTTNVPTATGGFQPGSGVGFTLDLTVTSAIMPTGISGTAIETYSSRVWIANGASLLFSSPGSFTGFATSEGGGSITSNDSSLRVRYVQLRQSNGYLYLIGDSSISYISGVQTTGNPPTTSFTLLNADPEVGTPWPDTVDVLGSDIAFGNDWGAHVSFGGRAAKVSPQLDGIYNTIPNFGGMIPSAAKAVIFGRRVWVLLLRVLDQVTGLPINKLFLWDQKNWCSTQQSKSLTFIRGQEINSVLTAWGTDGTTLFRLFQTPSTALTRTLQSKFWAPSLLYAEIKAENRLWALFQFFSGSPNTLDISIDSEMGQSFNSIPIAPSTTIIWVNDSLVIVPWENDALDVVSWSSSKSVIQVIPPQQCAQQGALVGFTIRTTASDIGMISVATMPIPVQYRG